MVELYLSEEGRVKILIATLVAVGFFASRCARVITEEWDLYENDEE